MSHTARLILSLDQILNTPAAFWREPLDYERPGAVARIVCNDGTSLSVQASHGHYCTPRTDEGPWQEVEVGYPTEDPGADWLEHKGSGDFKDVYAYVPAEKVRAFIEAHGGEKPSRNS